MEKSREYYSIVLLSFINIQYIIKTIYFTVYGSRKFAFRAFFQTSHQMSPLEKGLTYDKKSGGVVNAVNN
jgi:hypothetical protein